MMPDNPNPALPSAITSLRGWIKMHPLLVLSIIAATLGGAFIRTWLDINKSYEGVEATALSTGGALLLFVINVLAALFFWVVLSRVGPFMLERRQIPVRFLDALLIAVCALFLPSLLNMDVKVVQILPGVTELGVQDSTVFHVKDIYGAFTGPAERNIFTHVDPKIDEKIEAIVVGYGCEDGVSELARHVNRKILGAGYLTIEERDESRQRIALFLEDPDLSYADKADEIAREAIKAFGLEYVVTTFDNYVCQAVP